MNEPPVLDPPPAAPSRRRWPRRAAVGGVVILAVIVGWGLYLNSVWDRELREALAEAERDDPDWRLMDIEAKRPVLPDAENSSAQMARAKQAKPAKWLIWYFPPGTAGADVVLNDPEGFSRSLDDVPPPVRLDAEQERVLRAEMKRGSAAVAEARNLVDFPRGRHPIAWKADYVSSLLPWTQDSRDTVVFLRYDVMLRCQDGDLAGALQSTRASFNASRALRDEPFFVSQLIRSATRRIALTDLERILAQGEPPADALADFQGALEEDEKDNLFLVAVRGDRGMIDGFLELVQNGEVTHAQMRQALVTSSLYSAGQGLGLDLEVVALRGSVRHERAEVLRRMNRAVTIARLPPEEWGREMDAWQAALMKDGSPLQRQLLLPLCKVNESARRGHAETRCAIVLLALERFRQAQRRWPDRLEELTPAYLSRVPLDPYGGKPIRYVRRDDGVTVYSVGFDGVDNGGNVSDRWRAAGTDWGFRLWDVSKRGQPAPAR